MSYEELMKLIADEEARKQRFLREARASGRVIYEDGDSVFLMPKSRSRTLLPAMGVVASRLGRRFRGR